MADGKTEHMAGRNNTTDRMAAGGWMRRERSKSGRMKRFGAVTTVAGAVCALLLTGLPAMSLADDGTAVAADTLAAGVDAGAGVVPTSASSASSAGTVAASIPDDATVISDDYAAVGDRIVDLQSGETVTDPSIVGTAETPADPLAATGGVSFVPMTVRQWRESGAAEASAAGSETDGSATGRSGSGSGGSSGAESGNGSAAFPNGIGGAKWGTYGGAKAFYEGTGSLFARSAKAVIDVSEWQGRIDWAKVKASGVDAAIIRVSYGTVRDKTVQYNIAECRRLGIPFGVYVYSYAYDSAFAASEGRSVANILKSLGVKASDLKYPVFYDLEAWTWTGHTRPTRPAQYESIVNAWYKALQSSGYTNLGVYSYTSYLETALKSSTIYAKVRWVANYSGRYRLLGSKLGTFAFSTSDRMWQYTESGTVPGISGKVDCNAFGYPLSSSGGSSTPSKPGATSGRVPVYRVYNRNSGLHHYTTSAAEKNMLVAKGWRDESAKGAAFVTVPKGTAGARAVYREYNRHDGNHNWTLNKAEHDMLVRLGWKDEGVAWYAPASGRNVYRLYNRNSGEHVYTTSYGEYVSVVKAGWRGENVAWKSL
ncbi:glycosyl hydrolase family 25 [Bifidobacterium margollesii]|uniref:Glycosyl hydrolase family 25 n=1 Tax=Bifidobacterium margollesii TaxID=2020964 RepID=A0A2N5J6Z0_9BIFI|nr:glycoside hydrolase family 25 protein [Bifidobacterium margollesii]PLS29966.1 glycosyl hydrolase family 25 [Bifidobacterium margollesii]